MEAREISGEIFNIGSSERVRILDLAERVLELTGSQFEARPSSRTTRSTASASRTCCTASRAIDKISDAIGWRPSLDLDRILADVIEHTRRAPAVELA